MIRSMTGFGRGSYSDGKWTVTAQIRSVNHRYHDISIRMPRRYAFAEEKIREVIRRYVKRGKLDCTITAENTGSAGVSVTVNRALAEQYVRAFEELEGAYGLIGGIPTEAIAGQPDVLTTAAEEENEEEVIRVLTAAVEEAARNLDEMRQVEGGKLAGDLLARGRLIRTYVDQISARADKVPEEYRERLLARIDELLKESGVTVPEERIAAETAVFADKCSITEEVTRLYSHLDQLEQILGSDERASGKKLDFLVQEMNREANTIGSKANDLEITNTMLEMKAEIEKIREQVQNIE